MPKIKNPSYKQFIEKGIIEYITLDHIKQALKNVTGKHMREGRNLIAILYYTGARPNEILQLKSKNLTLSGSYLKIQVSGSKGGLPRPIHLPMRHALVKELWNYSQSIFSEMYLFYHFKNKSKRTRINKKKEITTNTCTTDKLRYYFKKWFDNVIEGGINPYFLRHNRFSKLSDKGASLEEIRMIKGSRTIESVYPYLHQSTQTSKKIAKKIE